ncbi:MAG: hypothetical protein AAGD06_04445 [Acidobacteriota bacterium]
MTLPSSKPTRFPTLTALALTVVLVSAAAPALGGDLFQHLDPEWMSQPYWYDGEAEVNRYGAEIVIYGQARKADDLAHILVTESHKPDLLVKADDWREDGLVGMLKFNYVTSVRTGVYAYQQMLSFFFDREDLGLAKMTLASHEWCGNTFKELVNFRGRSGYDFNTYWDGQGNGSYDVEFPANLVVYDSLPVQLRALRFSEGLEATVELLPGQLSSRVSEPRWSTAKLKVAGRERAKVPAGTFDAWVVELTHAGGTDRLRFEAAFPNRMLSWTQAGGNRFELASSDKAAYWSLNRIRDEEALPR